MSIRLRILITYILLINLATFIVRGLDKWKAVLQKWRISEKSLLTFCALGWFLGALLAMGVRRHKTVKTKFLVRFYLIVVLWIAGLITLYLLMN